MSIFLIGLQFSTTSQVYCSVLTYRDFGDKSFSLNKYTQLAIPCSSTEVSVVKITPIGALLFWQKVSCQETLLSSFEKNFVPGVNL